MSLFGKILDKLGFKKPAAGDKPAAPAKSDVKPGAASKDVPYRPTSSPKSAPVEMVDVMSKLETMGKGTNLDWKVSIVDLLKLLDLDNSLTARKELATELGCPADKMGGDHSAMNTWLHKTVLRKIAENGGNIPKELLD
jgi:hypothetical protein